MQVVGTQSNQCGCAGPDVAGVREFRPSAPGTGRPWETAATRVAARPAPRREGGGKVEADALLQSQVKVVNIGLREFARDLAACNVPVVHVDWSPPAVSDPKIADLLAKLGG
jgi:FdrA protein